MATMLLGGIWHGASWMFVIWGLMHGLFLVLQKAFAPLTKNISMPVSQFFTLFLIALAWTPFRAKSLDDTFNIIKAAFSFNSFAFSSPELVPTSWIFIGFSLLVGAQTWSKNMSFEQAWNCIPFYLRCAALAFVWFLLLLDTGPTRAFIYYQF
jgi:alginate O-acetyltransferase complex protein AlgI